MPPLSRPFKQTVRARVREDAAFRTALLKEAVKVLIRCDARGALAPISLLLR